MANVEQPGGAPRQRAITRNQKWFVGFILVAATVNVLYRLVIATGGARTAALFVGIPAALAIGLVLLPRTRSATGALLKGSTLALVLACVVLPEGLVCLLFVLPLTLLICLFVGGLVDLAIHYRRRQGPTLMAVSLPLLLMSLEGVVGSPFATHDAAVASIEVEATPAEVAAALAETPSFDAELPSFLRLGFNRPIGATGSGIDIGDERVIELTGGTHDDHPMRVFGVTGERSVDHHSTMHLRVVESAPGRVVFEIVHDTTMTARWADVQRSVVTWEPVGNGTTRVSWRIEYERLLFPSFYFAPLQRFAAGQAADYLLAAAVQEQLA